MKNTTKLDQKLSLLPAITDDQVEKIKYYASCLNYSIKDINNMVKIAHGLGSIYELTYAQANKIIVQLVIYGWSWKMDSVDFAINEHSH